VVFRHIQILKHAGIIEADKKGKFLMCCIRNIDKIKKYLED